MYEDLERLNALREKGAITEEEFIKEKKRILDAMNSETPKSTFVPKQKLWGMNEQGYCTLLHLSQFAGILIPLGGFILPIMMWLMGKEDSAMVDRHGRAVLNWMISLIIYLSISGILAIIAIGIPLLIILGVLNLIFVIKGAIKANEGEYWEYPMSMKFL